MFRCVGSVSSKIKLEVLAADGSIKADRNFTNIMTNLGLVRWTNDSLGVSLAIGSGSRAEVGTVTSLANYVRSANGSYTYSDVNFIDVENNVMRSNHLLTVLYPLETASVNYSEVGIHGGNINELQTYALIRDSAGNPTAVSILAGERIRVSYGIQFSMPLISYAEKDIAGVMTGVSVVPLQTAGSNLVRLPSEPAGAIRIYGEGVGLPAPGVAPAGGVASPRAATSAAGVYSLSLNQADANFPGGIELIRLGATDNRLGIMVHFNPPIPKTSGYNMTLTAQPLLYNGDYYD